MLVSGIRSLVHPDLAVDLGTATTRVSPATGGVMFTAPSKVDGENALEAGVIVDRDRAVELLRPIFFSARRWGMARPRVVACAPTDANADERGAVEDVVRLAGASAVYLVPEPLAAAVGSGIEIGSAYARMIVDIGYGVTDCAVVRSGEIVVSSALRVACGELERRFDQFVRSRFEIAMSPEMTRVLVAKISFDPCAATDDRLHVAGRSTSNRGYSEADVRVDEILEVLSPVHGAIVGSIASFLKELPPRVGVEIIESGIDLTGGGSMLAGMAESIEAATNVSVRSVPDALASVVRGARKMIPMVEKGRLWD